MNDWYIQFELRLWKLDCQPYLTTLLSGSDRDSSTADCDASPWSKPSHYQESQLLLLSVKRHELLNKMVQFFLSLDVYLFNFRLIMTLVLSLYLYEPPLFFLYIFLQHLKFISNNVITQTSTYKISWSKYLYLTL